MDLIYRSNHKFFINEQMIPVQYRKVQVINGLYAAIYEEFKGAIQNDKYIKLSPVEKIKAINDFASNWLKERGFV